MSETDVLSCIVGIILNNHCLHLAIFMLFQIQLMYLEPLRQDKTRQETIPLLKYSTCAEQNFSFAFFTGTAAGMKAVYVRLQ